MKTDFYCVPCIIKQAINTLKLCGSNKNVTREALNEVLKRLTEIDYNNSPAFNTEAAYRIPENITGNKDPYKKLKKDFNKLALGIYDKLKDIATSAKDPLFTAAKIAIESNIIDFGVMLNNDDKIDLNEILEGVYGMPLAINDYDRFKEDLKTAERILYISDNTGEIVFDRVFIEEILKYNKDLTLAVKSGPIINDVTMEDAVEAGLDKLVRIIETGGNNIGVNFDNVSSEFIRYFKEADIIIAKGHGNLETLDEIDANIYFLLKAKCDIVSGMLGVDKYDIVFAKKKKEWGERSIPQVF